MHYLFFIIVVFLLSACTVVNIHSENETRTYRKFGLVDVIDSDGVGTYVELDFIGIGFVDKDFVIGYKSSKQFFMEDDSCVVFIDKKSHINQSVMLSLKEVNCNFIYTQGETNDGL